MKITKPDNAALLYRAVRLENQNRLVIGLMVAFEFSNADVAAVSLLSEVQLWAKAREALGARECLDEGFSKPVAEFLVYCSAWTPRAQPAGQVLVTVSVGDLRKSLFVSGDRHFNAFGMASSPKPFVSMPITRQTAFGGWGFASNTLGKGFVSPGRADNVGGFPLPNVENPRQLVASRSDTPTPAGFWAHTPDLPQRTQHLGKFDQPWLAATWPHLPHDTNAKYFQVAPDDQRFSGFLRGDETIQIDNMHPGRASIRTALPALRARCFVNRRINGCDEFSELQTQAETVWLFPELECGIVLYRATAIVRDEDADEISHVMAEWEPMAGQSQDVSHYQQLFNGDGPARAAGVVDRVQAQAQAAPVTATATASAGAAAPAGAGPAFAVASAPDAGLILPAAETPELQELERLSAEFDKNFDAVMRENNLTQEDLAPYSGRDLAEEALLPTPEHSIQELEKMAAELEEQTQEFMRTHGLTDQNLQAAMADAEPELAETPLDVANSLREFDVHLKAVVHAAGVTQFHIDALAADAPELADILVSSSQYTQSLLAADAAAPAAVLMADAMPAAATPKLKASPQTEAQALPLKLTREDVVMRHAQRQGFAAQDLSGLDLSGLNLADADFSAALLDKTSFKDSRLAAADFRKALVKGGDFTGADLTGTLFASVSAGGAAFAKARMAGLDGSNSDFSGADFSQAELSKANFNNAIFDKAKMTGVKAAAFTAQRASFADCDLTGADLAGARLNAAVFNGAKLCGATFTAATCDNAEFYGVDASGAKFSGADLRASRADASSQFVGAVLTRAQMERASWGGAMLGKASLEGATLDNADFSRTQATDANFSRASAKGTKFDRADLTRADFTGVNLFNGSLRKANVEQTLMRKANLYGVDFYGSSPTMASLEGSNIDQTLLVIQPPLV